MTDDDNTPQSRPVELSDPDAARSDDPAIYLRQPPTPEEHNLSELVGLHNGAGVPWWMFSKVALRLKKRAEQDRMQDAWIAAQSKLQRKIRRHAWSALGLLLTNLVAIGAFLLHRNNDAVRLEEHAAATELRLQELNAAREREIEILRDDIRELRAMLRKLSDTRALPTDLSIARTP